MNLEDIRKELVDPNYKDVLDEHADLFENVLENGFRIERESTFKNYHKNTMETMSHYDIGFRVDGGIKKLNIPSISVKPRRLAKSFSGGVSLKSKHTGQGEFVDATPLTELEPKQAARVLTELVASIWIWENAARKLEEQSQSLKEELVKLS